MIAMLDYILSKMVLLLFLLLLVSAFSLVQQSLSSYFTQQAARGVASMMASHISQVVTTVSSNSERKVYSLPVALDAGKDRVPYDVNIVVYTKEGQSSLCYVGVLVVEQGSGRPLAFDSTSVGRPDDTSIRVCYRDDGVFARSSGVREQYLIIDRVIDLTTGNVYLTLCSASSPNAECSSCKGDLC